MHGLLESNSNYYSHKNWSVSLESAALRSTSWSGRRSNLGESKVTTSPLGSSCSSDIFILNDCSLDDTDGVVTGRVTTRHLLEHLRYSSTEGGVTVLFVHVDRTSATQILKYDTIVLYWVHLLLKDLRNLYDFTLNSSDLVLSLHLIPKHWTSEYFIFGEHANTVAHWLWFWITGGFSTDNPELT